MVRTRRQQIAEQSQTSATLEDSQLQNKTVSTTLDVIANNAVHGQDVCSIVGLVAPANDVVDSHMSAVLLSEGADLNNAKSMEFEHEKQPVNGVDKLEKSQPPSANSSNGEELAQTSPKYSKTEESGSMDVDKTESENLAGEHDVGDERVVKKLRIDDVVASQEDVDTLTQKRKRVPSKKAAPVKAKKAPMKKVDPLRRSKRPGVWDTEHLLTNKRSKIIGTESDVGIEPLTLAF